MNHLIRPALLMTLAASAAVAEPKEFTLDLGHAYVGWEIDHLGYSRTVGEFRSYDGTFLIDEGTPENSRISFTIDAASIDSNHAERDAHLRNADFLDVESHSKITFESTSVRMLTPTTGILHGDLTMLGVTNPIEIPFEMVKDAPYVDYVPNYDEVRTVGFEAEAEIFRLDYGMDFVGFVGAPVGLVVTADLHFDLVDCEGMPETNIPCNWGRE
ncbi:YceI family protein [Pontivivens ytuae]|uniref:YceI family protein n=1 Tax=Pontivivens ytuae TaxID=2789856 RepID=A0A7S9LU46_9RHOB|nr:YceI family protein [Pontivivens ytuae]QPH55272.1 YceI family protein [Pontivivens ytuae]